MKVFNYIPELDAFTVTDDFHWAVCALGIREWTPVVFIGRYFCMDNDFGEHWHDNWDERAAIEEKAKEMGYDSEELLIIDPKWFVDNKDGPCHTDEQRKAFWTEVCKCLDLSLEFLLKEAKQPEPLEKWEQLLGDRERLKGILKKLNISSFIHPSEICDMDDCNNATDMACKFGESYLCRKCYGEIFQ